MVAVVDDVAVAGVWQAVGGRCGRIRIQSRPVVGKKGGLVINDKCL